MTVSQVFPHDASLKNLLFHGQRLSYSFSRDMCLCQRLERSDVREPNGKFMISFCSGCTQKRENLHAKYDHSDTPGVHNLLISLVIDLKDDLWS